MKKFFKKWADVMLWSVVFIGVIVTGFVHNHDWIAVLHGATIALAFANIIASVPKTEKKNKDKNSDE